MKPKYLLSVGVVILALALPAPASAQRGGGHQGGFGARGVARPVVTAGQRIARPTIARPGVVNRRVIVRQPIVAGFATRHDKFGHIGFGSVPVRTGFGTPPVRTGFENPPFGTGVVAHARPMVAPFATGRAFRSKGFHTFRRSHVFGGAIIGYPYVVPYPYYVYPPYDGYSVPTVPTPVVPIPSAGYSAGAVSGAGYSAAGISAGPSTYYTDLANQPGASSGVTFQVSPAAAEVFVDGAYAGTVQDFWADLEPLMLVTGSHRIELRAPGYNTATLDVTTTPGQVIPFFGELEPLQ
jgi:hypothetical protein